MKQKDFKRESVRSTCALVLKKAVEYVNNHGFTVVVASDEEGNNWNTIDPTEMEYSPSTTKDNFIAISVSKRVEDTEVFDMYCYCDKPTPLERMKNHCSICYGEIKEG